MSSPAQRAVRLRMLGAWSLALLAGAAAFALAGFSAQTLPRPRPLEELSYYPSGTMLQPAMLGHAESAADLAWLRAVQYYGGHRDTDNRFTRMAHVFDILTSLSPRFVPAYVFGAFALAQEGGDFPAAERLMQKGLRANPRSGRLAFEAGFLYFVRPGWRDYPHASEYFAQAARQADAPPQSARFAAFAKQQSGELSVAYELWSEVARSSDNRYLREMAQAEMDRIRAAIAAGRPLIATHRLPTPVVLFK